MTLTIPNSVYREASLNDAYRQVLEACNELERLHNHYGHNVDVTGEVMYCSDCEVFIDPKAWLND